MRASQQIHHFHASQASARHHYYGRRRNVLIRAPAAAAAAAAAVLVAEDGGLPGAVVQSIHIVMDAVLHMVFEHAATGLHLVEDQRVQLLVLIALAVVFDWALRGDVRTPIPSE